MTSRSFLLASAATLLLSGCASTSQPPADPNAPPPLRVGVAANNAPLIYSTGRGTYDGVEAAFARQLGQELGRPVQFVSMNFDRLIPAVQRGEIDIIMSGMTVLALRQSLVDFTTPYMVSGQALLVPDTQVNLFAYPKIIFASPFRIGVESGSVGNILAQRAAAGSSAVPYASATKAADALRSGQVDCVLHDAPVLWRITADNPTAGYTVIPKLLAKETLAWAVRRGDATLLNQANAALAKWKANGTLDRTLRLYMPRYDIMQRM